MTGSFYFERDCGRRRRSQTNLLAMATDRENSKGVSLPRPPDSLHAGSGIYAITPTNWSLQRATSKAKSEGCAQLWKATSGSSAIHSTKAFSSKAREFEPATRESLKCEAVFIETLQSFPISALQDLLEKCVRELCGLEVAHSDPREIPIGRIGLWWEPTRAPSGTGNKPWAARVAPDFLRSQWLVVWGKREIQTLPSLECYSLLPINSAEELNFMG